MIVSISGAGGFIGSALTRAFLAKGWVVKSIGRETLNMADDDFIKTKIEGCDVVINLAGAGISERWTATHKQEILDSRIRVTGKIVSSILASSGRPRLLISASGIDIYDNQNTHDESSTSYAGSFLGDVCMEWEKEALKASEVTRVVLPRMGLVLGDDGGALSKMKLPFSLGLGAKIGNGRQWISFIHIKDLVNAYIFIIEHDSLKGPVNLVSPFPVSNRDFSSALGKALKQPVFLTLPGKVLQLIYGEGAILLLEGHKVLPGKLNSLGFHFNYPTINGALLNLCAKI